MRFFLTGGTGFVGAHVARVLVEEGHEVVALVRGGRRRRLDPLEGIPHTRVEGDLEDEALLRDAMTGADGVFHTAAQLGMNPREQRSQRHTNIGGTARVVDAALAAGVGRLVHTSSVAAIGAGDGSSAVDESAPYDWPPWLPYMTSKRDAEAEVLRGVRAGLDAVIVNPASVFGPGDVNLGSAIVFVQARRGLLRVVPRGACTTCDVRDVARAHWEAFRRGARGERYILGGESITLAELAALVCSRLGAPGPRVVLPRFVTSAAGTTMMWLEQLGVPMPVHGAHVRLSGLRYFHSSEKAVRDLDYRPRSLESSLDDTLAFYTEHDLL